MNIIFRVMVTVLLLCVSFGAQSQDNSELKKMVQNQAMSTCSNQSFLSCIGISKTKCTAAAKNALSSCDHLFPNNATSMTDTSMDAQRDCLRKSLLKSIGISEDKLHNCSMNAQNGPESGAPMNEGNVAQFQQMMHAIAKAKGTNDITLPVYENANIISQTNHSNFGGAATLPIAVMWSADSPKKVIKYYRKKLKTFKEFKVPDGILFMEHANKDFDLYKDINVYYSVPHVMVTTDVDHMSQDSKSRIEIGYRK